MTAYDDIINALGEEACDFRFPGGIDQEEAKRLLLSAPHDPSGDPYLMFAFDQIEKTGEAWRHTLKIELHSVSQVRSLREVRALLDLEAELTKSLMVRVFGEDYRTPNSWNLADMLLYFPRLALPEIYRLGQQRRAFLQKILDMNVPDCAPAVSTGDFFCAYSMGNYRQSQLQGLVWHYLSGTVRQGMETEPLDECDTDAWSYDKLNSSCADPAEDEQTASEEMESLAAFFNAWMRYRDLDFVKKKLEGLLSDAADYAGLLRFCEGASPTRR